jgi:hypothetical protein
MNNANTQSVVWRRGIIVGLLLLISTVATPAAHAQSRLVVRDSLGLPGINLTCALLGCNVVQDLGDPQGQLFVVVFPKILDPVTALLRLNLQHRGRRDRSDREYAAGFSRTSSFLPYG